MESKKFNKPFSINELVSPDYHLEVRVQDGQVVADYIPSTLECEAINSLKIEDRMNAYEGLLEKRIDEYIQIKRPYRHMD